MADMERVIKALHCRGQDLMIDLPACDGCDYQIQLVNRMGCNYRQLCRDAIALLKEQSERIAIMRESMETIERRLAAAECQPIAVKSTDQMVYVGWMHEDQKLGLSEG